ncbi:hypothetical protein [Macrococcus brunensis]|uniref:hypothetical protein n=1 Tax=Macrococcus brunensis TaxID=198483 RepID=UPI001EF05347|nr:hypothetical protein [Macrococcus brunensis]ULG70894.1 hypothetical protein MGG12_05885 [Macrococcus brunensis]
MGEVSNEESLKIDILSNDMDYWFLRTNGGTWYDEFYQEEQISIINPRLNIDDIKNFSSKEELVVALSEANEKKRQKIVADNEKRKDESKLSEKELEVKISRECLTRRSISMEANRLYNFIYGMKINDYVMIPSKSSYEFRIGLVASNVKKHDVESLAKIRSRSIDSKGKRKYYVSNNSIYRNVIWLKTIRKKEIDPEILSVLHMHQTIFTLNDFKAKLNALISPIYIQDNKLHINIHVNREEGIDNDLWLDFHKTIKSVEEASKHKVSEIKVDVQSPGYIELITFIDPQMLEILKDTVATHIKPIGGFGVGYFAANIFRGIGISKIGSIELVEKDSKKLKEAKERTQLAEERVKYKRLIIEDKKLQEQIDALDDTQVNVKLQTSIDGQKTSTELEE